MCLNHFIGAEMKFSFKENTEEKVVLWTSTDYSDPEEPNGEVSAE